jgi:2-keto-4-pentenoate hydratase/2-oxohepta-3-ene-1,7-dioic acid hydratase in catechol pathway
MPFALRVRGGPSLPAGKIVAFGKNYEEHRREMAGAMGSGAPGDARAPEEPVLFLKPSTCLLADGGTLRIPDGVANVHWETELAVIVGAPMTSGIDEAEALRRVLGYAVFLDMTARDLQAAAKRAGLPWALSKGMDGFGPISDVVRAADAPPWDKMELRLLVNGEERQRAPTGAMIHSVPKLLRYASRHMTLEPGDIVATGTPAGGGACKPGDVLEAELVGLARVRVTVR